MTGELRMSAYYYDFTRTGTRVVDKVLSAVACAGKAFHHTESWNDESEWKGFTGNTPVDWIQNAADEAAAEIMRLQAEVASLRITLGGRTFGPTIPEPIGCPAPGACAQVAEIGRLRQIIDTVHPQMQATIDRLSQKNDDLSAACAEGWDQARKRQDQVRTLEAERDRLRTTLRQVADGWWIDRTNAIRLASAALKETGHE